MFWDFALFIFVVITTIFVLFRFYYTDGHNHVLFGENNLVVFQLFPHRHNNIQPDTAAPNLENGCYNFDTYSHGFGKFYYFSYTFFVFLDF